jgi:hypothetical protein
MRAVVLVPRRSDGARRDKVWDWVRGRWQREHPSYTIYEGHHTEGKFNRSYAINCAAQAAGEWDVAIIADADTFCGPAQITDAVQGATTSGVEFWLAYDTYAYLSRAMSDQVMTGFLGNWYDGVEFTMTGTCSSMVVVTRRLWDEVGGFDPGFVGWGFEDVAFSHACQTFGGGLKRTPGHAWHLHHPSSPENSHRSPEWTANRNRMIRYGDASYDRDAMRALIDAR